MHFGNNIETKSINYKYTIIHARIVKKKTNHSIKGKYRCSDNEVWSYSYSVGLVRRLLVASSTTSIKEVVATLGLGKP